MRHGEILDARQHQVAHRLGDGADADEQLALLRG